MTQGLILGIISVVSDIMSDLLRKPAKIIHLTRILTSENSHFDTPHPALESKNKAPTKGPCWHLLMLERLYDHHCHHSNFGLCQKKYFRYGVDIILAPFGGWCGNNYGVPYRVPVYARHQSSKSTGERKNGEILVLTSPKATG